jgi:hypothetical protein
MFVRFVFKELICLKTIPLFLLSLFSTGCLNSQDAVGTWEVNLQDEFTEEQILKKVYITPDNKFYYLDDPLLEQQNIYEIPIVKISNQWQLPDEVTVIDLQDQVTENQRMSLIFEPKQYVGSMIRAQKSHYLQELTFTSKLEDLGLGIKSETNNYYYQIVKVSDSQVILFAKSKNHKLPSFLGVVIATDLIQSILCESIRHKIAIPTISSATNCPEGWVPTR